MVYAINEPAGAGAFKALQAAGKEKGVVVVGVDGMCSNGVGNVEKGVLAATSMQYPLKMAALGVAAGVKYAKDGVRQSGYTDTVLPGVANGSVVPPDWSPKVKAYQLWNTSVSYSGVKNLTLALGVKNLLDKDPPFSAAYDSNTGAGSSWEPRVADPRGRSYTFQIDYKFF